MNRKEFIKKEYYKHWEKKNNETTEDDYFNLIFKLFDSLDIASAFEVAIGDGKPFAKQLAQRFKVNGIDLSQDLVNIANTNDNIQAKYGDAEESYNNKYDLIYCLRSFWYFDNWKKVLRNMIETSNKYIIFDVLNGDNKEFVFDEINFRHTFLGKIFVAFKNFTKGLINLITFNQKYFMQPLIPLESYHLHNDIVEFINKNFFGGGDNSN